MSRVLFVPFLLAGLILAFTSASPSAAPIPEKLAAPKQHPVVQALLQTVDFGGIDDPKTNLTEALEQLGSKVPGLTFEVNERAFKQDGLPDAKTQIIAEGRPIPRVKGTFRRILLNLLQRVPSQSGASFLVREDHIEITTRAAQEAEIHTERDAVPARPWPALPPPAFGPAQGILGGVGGIGGLGGAGGVGALGGMAQLGGFGFGGGQLGNLCGAPDDRKIHVGLVSVSVDRQPLDEAFRQLRSQSTVNVVVDGAAREKVREPQTVTLLNAPVDTALNVLAEQADLEAVWTDNVFFVTTAEKAKKLKAKWPERRAGGGAPPANQEPGGGM